MTLRVVSDVSPEELFGETVPDEWPRLTSDEVRQHAPDRTLAVREGTLLAGRCSLWWRSTPRLAGARLGVIGHFAATGGEAALALLHEACAQLQQAGCSTAVGPMDGSTSRRYRLVTDAMTEPPFFLEPTNPPAWPRYFAEAGFSILANYTSGLNADLSVRDPREEELSRRFAARGVSLRQLNPTDFDDELRRIYAVATVSFRQGFLYTPLDEDEFLRQYRAIRPVVIPELVLLAEQEGRAVGFVFAVPDLLERQRTGTVGTAIIKTLAVLPEREKYGGLGSLMVDRIHERAQASGMTRVIHALMHESNQSRRISDRTGTTMRRYALFARQLGGR